jgi:hypothetical protein
MTADLSIIGIVFATILFIIFLAAVILYLSFRIKETFREEKKRGIMAAKIGFLIGILFLAGGSFYFFANTFGNIAETNPVTTSPTNPYLNFTVSHPPTVTFNTLCTVSFTVINPTSVTAHGATIQADSLFAEFVIQSSTHEIVGNVVKIGDVPPGTTIVSLNLSAPNKPGTVSDTVSLLFQEMTVPVTQTITISVEGGQNDTPSPAPSPTPSPTSDPVLYLSVSYPSSVSINSTFTMSFTIRNPTNATAHGATIEANVLFENFAIESSTRETVGNVVDVGDIPPGTTIISLKLLSPKRPGTVDDTLSLLFQEIANPVTEIVTISVRGGP